MAAVMSAADDAFYEVAARKRILAYTLMMRAIDGSLYLPEADADIQLFAECETAWDIERTKMWSRNSACCCCGYLCNVIFCEVDCCNNPYPRSRPKHLIIAGMGQAKVYWTREDLLQMIEWLKTGQQQGAERLRAAHIDCDAQELRAQKRGPLPASMQNPAATGQPAYNQIMQPAHAMQQGPPKPNLVEQLAQLSQLKASGALSQEQFDQATAKLIAAG